MIYKLVKSFGTWTEFLLHTQVAASIIEEESTQCFHFIREARQGNPVIMQLFIYLYLKILFLNNEKIF